MMIYMIIIPVYAVVSVALGSCVKDDIPKAIVCLSQLKVGIFAGSSPNKPFAIGNFDIIVQACRNGDLLTAIGCLEMAMGDCEDSQSDISIMLRKMFDTKKVRISIDVFCTNMSAYNSNGECLEHYHYDQDVCVQSAVTRFQNQRSSSGNVHHDLPLFYCEFYQTLMECIRRALHVKCSEEAKSFVKAVMEGFEPPICSERTATTTASECCKSSTHNILMILFSIFILILC